MVTGGGDWLSLLAWIPPGCVLAASVFMSFANGSRLPGKEGGATSPFRLFQPEDYTLEGLKYRRWAFLCLVCGVASVFVMLLLIMSIRQALR